jgi:hypothetical protein
MMALVAGCSTGGTMTIVRGSVEPHHFRFATVVPKRGKGPGGWRAACVHIPLRRAAGEPYLCRLGVEIPLENQLGVITTEKAQSLSAACANSSAPIAFESVTPTTPLVLACQSFKNVDNITLSEAIIGAVVKTECHGKTTPTQVGP